MADFSDKEDNLLVEAVVRESACGEKINWAKVTILFAHLNKSRHTLQQRLKTLRRTYGKDLARFPARRIVGYQEPLASEEAQQILEMIFAHIDKRDIHQSSGEAHLNVGEISPEGFSSILQRIGNLKRNDVFVHVGSGVGNVLAQASLETHACLCIGIDVRTEAVARSQEVFGRFHDRYPALRKILQLCDDIQNLQPKTRSLLFRATVLYSSCQLFLPTSLNELLEIISTLPSLRLVISTVKFCPRHTSRCSKLVCRLFYLQDEPVQAIVMWKNAYQSFYIYERANV